MARIPDQYAVGQPSWSAPTKIASYDSSAYAAPGRAQAALGDSVAKLGKSIGGLIEAAGQEDEQRQKYETETAFVGLDIEIGDELKKMERDMPADGAGHRDTVSKHVDTRYREFFKRVPDSLKGEYDLRMRKRAREFEGNARDTEYKRRDDWTVNDLNERLGGLYGEIDKDPDKVGEHIGKGVSIIEASRLPPQRKQDLIRKFGADAEGRYAALRRQQIAAQEGIDDEERARRIEELDEDIRARIRPSWEPAPGATNRTSSVQPGVAPAPEGYKFNASEASAQASHWRGKNAPYGLQQLADRYSMAPEQLVANPKLIAAYIGIAEGGSGERAKAIAEGFMDRVDVYGGGIEGVMKTLPHYDTITMRTRTVIGGAGDPNQVIAGFSPDKAADIVAHIEQVAAGGGERLVPAGFVGNFSPSAARVQPIRQSEWANVKSPDGRTIYAPRWAWDAVRKGNYRDFDGEILVPQDERHGSRVSWSGGGKQKEASASGPRPDKAGEFLVQKLARGYESRTADVANLKPVVQDRLAAFLAAAEDAGHDIRVISGYRDSARQAVLWRNAVAKYGSEEAARRWVAPPGGSSHESGEAIDLQYGDRGAGLGGKRTAAVAWAHENARKFGMHFPLGHEDWHIEPVEARAGGKRFGGTYAKAEPMYKGGGERPKLAETATRPVSERGITQFAGMSRLGGPMAAESARAAIPDPENEQAAVGVIDDMIARGDIKPELRDQTLRQVREIIRGQEKPEKDWFARLLSKLPGGNARGAEIDPDVATQGAEAKGVVTDPTADPTPPKMRQVMRLGAPKDEEKTSGRMPLGNPNPSPEEIDGEIDLQVNESLEQGSALALPKGVAAAASDSQTVRTILDGIPDDQPLSAVPDDIRAEVLELLPRDAEKKFTINGQKVSALDAVPVGEIKKALADSLRQTESQRSATPAASPSGQTNPESGLTNQGVSPSPRKPVYQFRYMTQKEADKQLNENQLARRNLYLNAAKGEAAHVEKYGVGRTDKEGRTFIERAAKVLTPNQLQAVRQQLEVAKLAHEVIAPADDMTDAELMAARERLEVLETDSPEVAAAKAKVQARADAKFSKLRSLRNSDPAAAVHHATEVVEARRVAEEVKSSFSMGTGPDGQPTTNEQKRRTDQKRVWESTIDARIAAQERIFGERYRQSEGTLSPIRLLQNAEVYHMMGIREKGDWSRLSEVEKTAHLERAARIADATYGKHARAAFNEAVREVADKESRESIAPGMVQKFIRGEPVSAVEVQRYEMLRQAGVVDGFITNNPTKKTTPSSVAGEFRPSGAAPGGNQGLPALMQGMGAAPVAPTVSPAGSPMGGTAGVGVQVPPKAVQWLMQDPIGRAQVFDERFGKDAARTQINAIIQQINGGAAQPRMPKSAPAMPAPPKAPKAPAAPSAPSGYAPHNLIRGLFGAAPI